MYEVGDRMVYGMHGVCQVAAREERKVDKKRQLYLVLEPVGQEGSQYMIPTGNAAAMAKLRPLLTKEEMEQLLCSPQVHTSSWIQDENQRKQRYREIMGSGDRQQMMQMVYTLYRHREAQAAMGKKCHVSDEFFLRDAEKLLIGEMTVVLDMDQEQAKHHLQAGLS